MAHTKQPAAELLEQPEEILEPLVPLVDEPELLPLEPQAGPTYRDQIDRARMDAALRRPMDRRTADLSESPLFGGRKQGGLF